MNSNLSLEWMKFYDNVKQKFNTLIMINVLNLMHETLFLIA